MDGKAVKLGCVIMRPALPSPCHGGKFTQPTVTFLTSMYIDCIPYKYKMVNLRLILLDMFPNFYNYRFKAATIRALES